jgi:hypothetical protein
MPTEENKRISWRLQEEVFGQGKLKSVDELLAPDYVSHAPGDPELSRGPEVRASLRDARSRGRPPPYTPGAAYSP